MILEINDNPAEHLCHAFMMEMIREQRAWSRRMKKGFVHQAPFRIPLDDKRIRIHVPVLDHSRPYLRSRQSRESHKVSVERDALRRKMSVVIRK